MNANVAPVPAPSTSSGVMQPMGNIAAISVSARIPDFWVDIPRLWFAQFESVMDPQKQSDISKFNMVIAKLNRDAIQQVGDLIYTPPNEGKYECLKNRLLRVYEESAEKQFNKLVSEMDLGTQKPSQLLRRMSGLATNTQVSNEALRRLWISRLPTAVKTVLTVIEQDTKLESLSEMADRIMENMQTGEIAAITTPPPPTSSSSATDLIEQMKNMTLELKELRYEVNEIRGRRMDRGNAWQRNKSRSQSRGRRTPSNTKNWLCRYHYRWRRNAKKCEQPCNWKQPQASDTSEN